MTMRSTSSIGALQGHAPGGVDISTGQIYTASTFGRKVAQWLARPAPGKPLTATIDIGDGPVIRRVRVRPVSHGNGFASYVEVESVEVLPRE